MMTDYVATRWYRAPEILLASSVYTKGVDMWSLGCILAEMITGRSFFAGSSTINQIDEIMCCIARPTRHLQSIQSPYAASILSQVGRRLIRLVLACSHYGYSMINSVSPQGDGRE